MKRKKKNSKGRGKETMAGQIIKKGTDKFMVRVYLGEDENGKRRYFSNTIVGNRKAAEKYLNEILHKKYTDRLAKNNKITVKQQFDEWFEVVKNRVSPKTFNSYMDLAKSHIIPSLGNYRLDKLKPIQIQLLYNNMTDKGLSSRTVRYTQTILKNCLKQAIRWEYIYKNPAELFDLSKK